MKYLILLLFSLNLSAQSLSIEYSIKQAKDDIDNLKSNFEDKVFERIIPTSEVETIPRYHPNAKLLPFDTNHYLFYRFFDFDDVEIDSLGNVYSIGKVFVSERYTEEKYQIKFKDSLDYFDDKDGFFYYCKLYFSQYHKNIGLNIYLNMIPNICEKGMHLNSVVCPGGEKMDSKNHDTQHGNSVKILIKYSDYSYSDFIPSNSLSNAVKKEQKLKEYQLLTNPLLNTNIDSNIVKKRHFIRERVNLSKRMKIFEIDTLNKSISLKYTKPSDNEDFISNGTYSLTQKEKFEKNYPAIYRSSNPEIYNLIFSAKPDDQFIMGKSMGFSRVLMTDKIQEIMKKGNGETFSEMLEKNESLIKRNIEYQKKIESDTFEINKLSKNLSDQIKSIYSKIKKLDSYKAFDISRISKKNDYYKDIFSKLSKSIDSKDSIIIYSEINGFLRKMEEEVRVYSTINFPISIIELNNKITEFKNLVFLGDTLKTFEKLKGLYNEQLFQKWQDSTKSKIVELKNLIIKSNAIFSDVDSLNTENNLKRIVIKNINIKTDSLSQEGEKLKYLKDLFERNNSKYVYIDSLITLSRNFQNQAIISTFYVRRALPDSSNIKIGQELFNVKNVQFTKGTIANIYDPFTGEIGFLRRTVKSKMPSSVKKGWRRYYFQYMSDLLCHQNINFEKYDDKNSQIIVMKFEGKNYFWIKLSKPMASNIEILPFFVSKNYNFKTGTFKRKTIKDYNLGGKGLL